MMHLTKYQEKAIRKATKLIRHLHRFPDDKAALKALVTIDKFNIACSLKDLPEFYGSPTVTLLMASKSNAFSY